MIEQVAEIVAAYVRKNSISPAELPALIVSVNTSLAALGQPAASSFASLTPAVPIRRSIGPEFLTCLDCGQKSKMLKRHISTAHGMSVDEYRTRGSLPSAYPMVATN